MAKIIHVDMDNTICNYSKKMAKELTNYRLYNPDNKDFPSFDIDITEQNWWMFNLNNYKTLIQKQDHFFLDLEPISGAINALNELENAGYTVFIVSSPSIKNSTCYSDKMIWLLTHMGSKWAKKLILTKDKTLVHGDYLIDDKIIITGIQKPSWK